jgi:hypothetical protein
MRKLVQALVFGSLASSNARVVYPIHVFGDGRQIPVGLLLTIVTKGGTPMDAKVVSSTNRGTVVQAKPLGHELAVGQRVTSKPGRAAGLSVAADDRREV